mmetsp:Transcript_32258/g.96316  ORF Transcript_32258/g.96316 Transcript_32258/m.96316 type:complete len:275 (+) Transcript_32258:192-1016(+)
MRPSNTMPASLRHAKTHGDTPCERHPTTRSTVCAAGAGSKLATGRPPDAPSSSDCRSEVSVATRGCGSPASASGPAKDAAARSNVTSASASPRGATKSGLAASRRSSTDSAWYADRLLPYTTMSRMRTPSSSVKSALSSIASTTAPATSGSSSPTAARVCSCRPHVRTSRSYGSTAPSDSSTSFCALSSPTISASTIVMRACSPRRATSPAVYSHAGPPTATPPGASSVTLLNARRGCSSKLSTAARPHSLAPTTSICALTESLRKKTFRRVSI